MPHRFFLANLSDSGTAVLDGIEAHHLLHVLRASPGDIVELFNGAGLVAKAEVVKAGRRDIDLRVLDSHREEPSSRQVIIGTAVPKGDRFDWLIEKATELGVTRLVPLTTERSVVDPRDSKLDKLRQTVIAACKQSGRNHLLELSPVTTWASFVKETLSSSHSFVAHPGPGAPVMSSELLGNHSQVAFAIGPEGGFTDGEVALAAEHKVTPISLGPLILRIETAAVALAACTALRSL
jgi:16S rRNA (uracil1498-N3)-methyltransferase